MICLILAAGYATRLYPLTENFPKPLLDVQGRTVLDWLLSDVDGIEGIGKNHRYQLQRPQIPQEALNGASSAWFRENRYHVPCPQNPQPLL